MFSTSCTECGREYQLHNDKANKRLKCKDCGQIFVARPAAKKQRPAATGKTSKSRPQQLPPRAGGGRSKRNRQPAKRASSSRPWPVFVGIGVVAVGGIALLVFAISGNTSEDVAATDPAENAGAEVASVTDATEGENAVPANPSVQSPSESAMPSPEMALNFQSRKTAAEQQWRQPSEPRQYPSLPDAIRSYPTWLTETPNAPFDLAVYTKLPAAQDNAAPLYLDALYEFSVDVEGCFPESERAQRTSVVRARQERMLKLHRRWSENYADVNLAEVDALLAEYEAGFKKLAAAQQKPACRFQEGIGIAALLPHVQAARSLVRVACLRSWRDCQQGNVDAAIGMSEQMFRLTRDINSPGQQISALVATACDRLVCDQMLRQVLLHPDLTTQQCDQLLSIVQDHAQQKTTMWARAIQGEYIMYRVLLHDLQYRTGDFSPQAIERFELDRAQLRGKTFGQFAISHWFNFVGSSSEPPTEVGDLIDAMTDDEFAKEVTFANGIFKSSLDALDRPISDLRIALQSIQGGAGSTGRSPFWREFVTQLRVIPFSVTGEVVTRAQTVIDGSLALICVRRWQLEHGQSVPPDLNTALQEAGITQPLSDAYSTGEPLKLTTVADQPVIYSVGGDGKDDQGLIDSGYDPNRPGDWTFRLESYADQNRRFKAASR